MKFEHLLCLIAILVSVFASGFMFGRDSMRDEISECSEAFSMCVDSLGAAVENIQECMSVEKAEQ